MLSDGAPLPDRMWPPGSEPLPVPVPVPVPLPLPLEPWLISDTPPARRHWPSVRRSSRYWCRDRSRHCCQWCCRERRCQTARRCRWCQARRGCRSGQPAHQRSTRWPRAIGLGPEQRGRCGVDVVVPVIANAVSRVDRAGKNGVAGCAGISGGASRALGAIHTCGPRQRHARRPHAIGLGPKDHPGGGIDIEVPIVADIRTRIRDA